MIEHLTRIISQYAISPKFLNQFYIIKFISKDTAQILDRRSQLDVVYADLTKAFDRVNHQLLVRKLSTFGLSNELTDLFDSYLADRRNCVVINGYMSDCYISLSGVPQWSTLGPLLFSMYVRDVSEYIYHSKILIFADEVKLYRQVNKFTTPGLCQLSILLVHKS